MLARPSRIASLIEPLLEKSWLSVDSNVGYSLLLLLYCTLKFIWAKNIGTLCCGRHILHISHSFSRCFVIAYFKIGNPVLGEILSAN